MKLFLTLTTLSFLTSAYGATCVPAHEYFPFEGKWATKNDRGEIILGMYSRMSPDGKYVLRSFSGQGLSQVTLMELVRGEKNSVKPYETPMKNEAFPVQGSWRYLVDIGGEHYKLSDIVKNQKKAQRQFKGGITGFYTVAAELNGGSAANHKIRSLSWPTDNGDNQGVGVLSNRVITAGLNKNGVASKLDNGSIHYMCANLRSSDGQIMSLPMISMDGSEFASMPQNPKDSESSMRIYKFGADNKSCEKVQDLKVAVAKVIFSRPELNAVLFYASGALDNRGNGVYFYDRDVKETFTLDDPDKKVRADSFPGFTNDGRIVYGAYWKDCSDKECVDKAGYVISDPYQSADVREFRASNPEAGKKFKECVTEEEVKANSEAQAAIWSYTL